MSDVMDDDDPEVVAGPHDPQPDPEVDWGMETISDGGTDPWAVLLVMLMIGAVVLAVIWLVRFS